MTEEIFKPIPYYEEIYEVSNMGNVRSLRFDKIKILKPLKHKFGYLFIDLCKNNVRKKVKIHQLVAMAFLGHTPCGHKLVVDHINGIKTDNRLENLNLITQRENLWKKKGVYSSQYTGVYWHKVSKKWVSVISINKKNRYLGAFNDEYDAHLAYQSALKEFLQHESIKT